MRQPPLVPIIVAAALASCATAEADRVCVTEPLSSAQVPAAAGLVTLSGQPLPIPLKLQLDLGAAVPELDQRGVSADLAAESLSMTSPEGADFSGVEQVSVTVSAPGRPDVVFTYVRPASATGPVRLVAALPDRHVDLMDYVQNRRTLTIGNPRFTGRLPSTAWTPHLRTCAAPTIDVNLARTAGL